MTPVSEFGQLRDEVDDLRGRVAYMQHQQEVVNLSAARADKAAQAADRQLAKSRSEWREVVNDLEAGMNQVISLLTSPATVLPARRPENTQSASESPLT